MEGSWLNKMTVIWGDKASHERIAKLCRTPILPTKRRGAEKIEIEGLSESPKVLEPSSGFTKWSLKEGKHWVAYNERAISSNPESQIEQSPASIACREIERKHEEKRKSKIKLKKKMESEGPRTFMMNCYVGVWRSAMDTERWKILVIHCLWDFNRKKWSAKVTNAPLPLASASATAHATAPAMWGPVVMWKN